MTAAFETVLGGAQVGWVGMAGAGSGGSGGSSGGLGVGKLGPSCPAATVPAEQPALTHATPSCELCCLQGDLVDVKGRLEELRRERDRWAFDGRVRLGGTEPACAAPHPTGPCPAAAACSCLRSQPGASAGGGRPEACGRRSGARAAAGPAGHGARRGLPVAGPVPEAAGAGWLRGGCCKQGAAHGGWRQCMPCNHAHRPPPPRCCHLCAPAGGRGAARGGGRRGAGQPAGAAQGGAGGLRRAEEADGCGGQLSVAASALCLYRQLGAGCRHCGRM